MTSVAVIAMQEAKDTVKDCPGRRSYAYSWVKADLPFLVWIASSIKQTIMKYVEGTLKQADLEMGR